MMPVIWLAPSLYEPKGRQVAIDWSTFAERAASPRAGQAKEALSRWAPVEFRGAYRCLAGVLRAHAVVLDVDDGSELEKVSEALSTFFVIMHSTFSATPEHPRWRVVVPLDQPVDADGYERVWRWLAMQLEATGIQPDYGARDASRAWAVPARPPTGFYVATTNEGAFLDAAEAFAVIPKPEPLPDAPAERSDSYDRRLERAGKYLATMPGGIQGSNGSKTTMKAAVVLVKGFGLDPDDALRLLLEIHNPQCVPMWSERELVHKIRSAVRRGRMPFGLIADRGRAA
jgi:hypothetical protein